MATSLKDQIIAEANRLGIDKIGFTTAEDFSHLKPSLQEQQANGHSTGFEHQVLDERLYPDLIFDQPQSIIAVALAYPSKLASPPPRRGPKRGQFARASWGEDYHTLLREKMTELIAFIKAVGEASVRFKPMVDTGELIDVVVAQRAGLGFIGKNGLLITPEFGSFVYLGEIITNIPFEPDTPMASMCGECTRCIDYCPPKALLGDGRLNGMRCLSYQTQTKGYMDAEFRPLIRNVIYGCDICQLVCPFNKGKDSHFHERMEPAMDAVFPELQPMLDMSNKQFKEQFGALAGAWRGKKPLQRNAIIALVNLHDQTAIPKLLEVVEKDVRPVIRATAAWAIGELERHYNPEIITFLSERRALETEPEAIAEFDQALSSLKARA